MSAVISMIVPVYQVEKYIAQCIESVLNQTFCDFELILVDDGSKDDSGKICDSYATKDNRVTVIHTENKGAASARNTGLDHSQGKYIMFLDGDDYLSEQMIEKMYRDITAHQCDISVCDFLNLTEDGNNFVVHTKDEIVDGRTVLEVRKNERNHGLWTVVWNKIYRREVLEKVRFPEGKYFEDEYFCTELYPKVKRIHVMEDVLCYHRVLSTSTMNTQKTENYIDLLEALQKRLETYIRSGYSSEETFRVLIYLLDPYTKCIKAHFDANNRNRVLKTKHFIQNTASYLLKQELPSVKKCSLVLIRMFPSQTYQTAVLFRGILEKYL